MNRHTILVGSLIWIVLQTACSQTCPNGWNDFRESCYKFIRRPQRNLSDAQKSCREYNTDLVAVNTLREHNFIRRWLRENDPHHRRWYTSGKDDGDNVWTWTSDNSVFLNIDALFAPVANETAGRYAAYSYSTTANMWGLQKVSSTESMSYICEISKGKLNQIIIIERDIGYGIPVLDKRKIPRGPNLIQEPEDVIFEFNYHGETKNDAVMTCLAAGYPPPVYKWFKEELRDDKLFSVGIDPLSNPRFTQTEGTFLINNPRGKTYVGNYHCTAENQFGIIISQSVLLSFVYVGLFVPSRSNENGKENWGKFLSCDAPESYPGLNYYWAKNSFPDFVEDNQRIFLSRDGNLYFSYLDNMDTANYSCNVRSVASPTSRDGPFFHLQVEQAASGQRLFFPNGFPKFFPEAPLLGQDVRLECLAYGYPAPSYNWSRSGYSSELPPGSYLESYNRVLILPKVKVDDIGEYYCTVSSGAESARKPVSLSIEAKPEFTIPLENKVMDKGSLLEWVCEAFGIPDVEYSWLKNGEELRFESMDRDTRDRYKINENVLSIADLVENDEGMYQCKATNRLGAAYSSGQLRVIALKPSFEKYPMESLMYAGEGGNVTIPCRPEAAPFPEFIWKRDNDSLSSTERLRILSNGYLYINLVTREDEGLYTCIAKNEYGSDQTSGLLIVSGMPCFRETPQTVTTAVVNELVELPCVAQAADTFEVGYVWLLNGLRIETEKQQQFMVGRLPGYLLIKNITIAEAGTYECIAKTSFGVSTTFTHLRVFGPPGAPGAVLAEVLTTTSCRIHWSDGSDNGYPIKAYKFEGRTNHDPSWVILGEDVEHWKATPESDRKEVELYNLSPWSSYSFRVSARNDFGYGKASEPSVLYDTDVDRPYVAPSNIAGGGGNVGSLTIIWDPLPPQEWNAPGIWYKVSYKPAESGEPFTELSLKEWGNIASDVVHVGEENYYKPYLVKVQSINSVGAGPYSDEVKIYSAENFPLLQLSDVHAVAHNSTALNVSWSRVDLNRENIRGKLLGYKFKYWEEGTDPEKDSLISVSRRLENWGLLTGLRPDTEYHVSAMAYNGAGRGPESESCLARTFKFAPRRRPFSVRIQSITSTSLLVRWRSHPTQDEEEEPILGYKVRYWEVHEDLKPPMEVTKYLDGGELSALLCGLTEGIIYKLRVLAFNKGGDGRMSSPPYEFRLELNGFPTISSSYNTSSTAIRIQWTPPPNNIICGEFLGYHFLYWPQNVPGERREVTLRDPTLSSYTIRNLDVHTVYIVSVKVLNPTNDGPGVSINAINNEEEVP